jgi:hypothetical protein
MVGNLIVERQLKNARQSMILKPLSTSLAAERQSTQVRSARDVFIDAEKQVNAPFAIIFQAEHSILAGQLALALDGQAFGELPLEVIEATEQHDFGWNISDEGQVEQLGRRSPRPFPDLSVDETLPSWRQSIAHAQHTGPLAYVLISRHFTLLGMGEPGRAEFLRSENERRAEAEHELPYATTDLDRWTAALGFCDLLSLYLCCGSREPAQFPMAHPASPEAAHANRTVLTWQDDSPAFMPAMLKPGSRVAISVRSYKGQGTELMPLELAWVFPTG